MCRRVVDVSFTTPGGGLSSPSRTRDASVRPGDARCDHRPANPRYPLPVLLKQAPTML